MNIALNHLFLSSISLGEPVAGYLSRNQYGSDRSLQARLWRLIGKSNSGSTTWLLPTNLNAISAFFGDAIGTAGAILENNTLFPAFSKFLPPDDRDLLEHHHYFNCINGMAAKLGLHVVNSSGRLFGACQKCVSDDVASDGRPFWRREFLMPGIEFCWKHHDPLTVGCSICRPKYGGPETILHLEKRCVCDTNRDLILGTYTPADIDRHIDLSRGFSRLLDPTVFVGVENCDLRLAIKNKASSLALTAKGRVNIKRTVEYFNDNNVGSALTRGVRSGFGLPTLRGVLHGEILPRSPILGIQLLLTLFGSWRTAEQEIVALSRERVGSTDPHSILEVKRTSTWKTRDRAHAYMRVKIKFENSFPEIVKAYHAMRKRYPDENHSEIVMRLPSEAQRLTRKRLIQANEDTAQNTPREGYYQSLDKSIASHIRTNRKLLAAANYDKRVSRNILLKGHRMVSVWARIEGHLPLAKAALVDCEESTPDFRRRRLKELVGCNR